MREREEKCVRDRGEVRESRREREEKCVRDRGEVRERVEGRERGRNKEIQEEGDTTYCIGHVTMTHSNN